MRDENGNSRAIEEKTVVYWSRKFQARAKAENKKFLDFLKKPQEHPENFRISAAQPLAIIIASKLTVDAREVIDNQHGLTQIEEQFRMMKGTPVDQAGLCKDTGTYNGASADLHDRAGYAAHYPEADHRFRKATPEPDAYWRYGSVRFRRNCIGEQS